MRNVSSCLVGGWSKEVDSSDENKVKHGVQYCRYFYSGINLQNYARDATFLSLVSFHQLKLNQEQSIYPQYSSQPPSPSSQPSLSKTPTSHPGLTLPPPAKSTY